LQRGLANGIYTSITKKTKEEEEEEEENRAGSEKNKKLISNGVT